MTIKEIAQLAGVSSAAVSRYLNGGYVSEGKKEQIRKVIEETGYQPSAQARMLRTKKASLVGVVVPKINSESISRITAGIESVLAERGYQMLLAGTDNTPAKEVEYLRLFENYPVDGIILVGTMFTAGHRKFLKETKVPVVVIGQRTSHANCIYHDDYGAGKAMGQAVAGFSKKGVAYIGVTRDDKAAGAAREDGFIAGLKNAGVTLFEENKRTSAFTLESGYESALDLLESKCDIDVISCATDTIAAGAIEAIQTYLKKQIPTNAADAGARMRYILENTSIRVTGFGDNQMLKAVTGGIPTIHFGYKTSGIRGAELLLDSIERASLLAKVGKNNLIKLELTENNMEITSKSEEGNVKEDIIISKEGNDLVIGFNSKYLIDALKVIEEEQITMLFNTSISPCLIRPVTGENFEYLILPVRITGN